jgi:hypothetical protein
MFPRPVPLACCLALALTGVAAADEVAQKPWKATANVYGYVVPDEPDFVMVTAPVEIGRWHVEGRYNYEALRLTLAWWKLDFYAESETVIDFHDAGDSFFYAWSELGFTPVHWTRFGLALQRSRVFENSRDVQRGLFASVTLRFVTLALYEFNAPWTTPTWVLAVSVGF